MKLDKIDSITPTEYARYIYIEKMLNMIKTEVGSACDVGCGVGNLMSVLEEYNIRTKGIDISETALDLARRKIASPLMQIENKNVFDLRENFDLVYMSEVLEHIEDDAGLLLFLNKNIIKNGGYMILTVPAHGFLYSPFDRSVGHFRRYGKKNIISMLKNAGFDTLLCWSYGSILFYLMANLPFYLGLSKAEACLKEEFNSRTMASGVRKFSGPIRFLVSKVNLLHRICFIVNFSLKNSRIGDEYCILCKSSRR